MKKTGVIAAVAIVIILILGSCNKQVCPAYAGVDGVKTEKKG